MTIVITMYKLMFAMIIGFYLNKKNILDKETSKKISALIVKITCPLLIITSVTTVTNSGGEEVILLLVSGAVLYTILPFLSIAICKAIRVPKDCMGTYRAMVIFSNNSFMGYPVVEALIGTFAIFYATIFNLGFNILMFSYGMFIMARDAGQVTKLDIKAFINPGFIAAILSIIIYFTKIQLPEIVVVPFSFIGNLTTPLSMLVIGSNMANYPLKDIFSEKKIYIITVIRLAVMPVLVYFAMSLVTDNSIIKNVVTLTIGMPVAAMVAMGSSAFEKQGKHASIAVVLTTICSMITIPVMAFLLGL